MLGFAVIVIDTWLRLSKMKTGLCLLVIYIFLLPGCATKVVSIYNYDIIIKNPSTFLIIPASESTSLSADNKKLDSKLQTIISNSLEIKGLKDSAIPDLYVSYIISVHTSSETQQDNYSQYNRYYYSYPYNYSTRNYKEGVLIIDVKNDDGKLIWQGSKTFKITSKQSVEELLPEICREIITAYNFETKY
jgi:hypothetical protein